MSFETILQQIVGDCGGGTAIALVGSDGIPILTVPGPEPEANPLTDEMAQIVEKNIRPVSALQVVQLVDHNDDSQLLSHAPDHILQRDLEGYESKLIGDPGVKEFLGLHLKA